MKKLIFILAAILIGAISTDAQAQTVQTDRHDSLKNLSVEFHYGKDSLINADTSKYTFNLKGVKRVLTLETKVKKIDGTVAGTVKFWGSIDNGVTWKEIATDTLDNADKNIWFLPGKSEYVTYKLEIITSGTQRCYVTPMILYRE